MESQKGEIWLVNFDPKISSEIGKIRPAVVVSSNAIGILPLRIVVPITSWQHKFENTPWLVKISRNQTNGLSNDSAADTFQVKSISTDRLVKKIGLVTHNKLQEITDGIMLCLGY